MEHRHTTLLRSIHQQGGQMFVTVGELQSPESLMSVLMLQFAFASYKAEMT